MSTLSNHVRRIRNIVAAEVFSCSYTAKANLMGKNCIFIHIPKTAGTSITQAFNLTTTNHYTAQELRWWMGSRSYGRFYSFCIARNPYDRFLSLYHYARLEHSTHHSVHPEDTRRKHSDYDLLKDASINECADLLRDGKLSALWKPQTDWFLDTNGDLLVNYVGHYETLEYDFALLSFHICGEVMLLPRVNESGRQLPCDQELTEYAITAIESVYARDLATLDY